MVLSSRKPLGLFKVVLMDPCPAVVDVNLLLSGISWTQILDSLRQMLGCSFRAPRGAPESPKETHGQAWTEDPTSGCCFALMWDSLRVDGGGLIPEQQLDLYLHCGFHSLSPHLLLLDSVSG